MKAFQVKCGQGLHAKIVLAPRLPVRQFALDMDSVMELLVNVLVSMDGAPRTARNGAAQMSAAIMASALLTCIPKLHNVSVMTLTKVQTAPFKYALNAAQGMESATSQLSQTNCHANVKLHLVDLGATYSCAPESMVAAMEMVTASMMERAIRCAIALRNLLVSHVI